MTPRTPSRRWMAALLACLATLPCPAAEPAADAGWILQRLARPAPTRTPFLELRESPLLKAPLRVSGEYVRPDDDTLVRRVASPYAENTTIRDGQVAIERDGRVRRFALSRAPELAGLQAGFGALLAGDRGTIERHYAIQATGPRGDWTMTLVPKDAALGAKLRDIVLYGHGAELRCIETRPVEGALQRTLVAGAAQAAHGVVDAAALAALCRDGAA